MACFRYFCNGRLHSVSGESVPVPGHPPMRKVFPDLQREPSVFQFVPTAWSWHWMPLLKAWLHPLFSFPSVTCRHWWDPSEPSFLPAEQSQIFQSFLMEEILHSFIFVAGLLQSVYVSLALRTPALNTALQVRPRWCWAEGKDWSLPLPWCQYFSQYSPGCHWPPLHWEFPAGSHSAWCPPEFLLLSFQAAFQLGGPQHPLVPVVVRETCGWRWQACCQCHQLRTQIIKGPLCSTNMLQTPKLLLINLIATAVTQKC